MVNACPCQARRDRERCELRIPTIVSHAGASFQFYVVQEKFNEVVICKSWSFPPHSLAKSTMIMFKNKNEQTLTEGQKFEIKLRYLLTGDGKDKLNTGFDIPYC